MKPLTPSQWEALCAQCGKCCYLWLDSDTRSPTEACSLLDKETGKCTQYKDRFGKKLEAYKGHRVCVKLDQRFLKDYAATGFLPKDCAYIKAYGRLP
jgi:hypothetical protein